uniref:Uncharacterized protein n=1 Tax=Arundo donax TaxID=35708 RepID=A0A0A9DS45_ARUDO
MVSSEIDGPLCAEEESNHIEQCMDQITLAGQHVANQSAQWRQKKEDLESVAHNQSKEHAPNEEKELLEQGDPSKQAR